MNEYIVWTNRFYLYIQSLDRLNGLHKQVWTQKVETAELE